MRDDQILKILARVEKKEITPDEAVRLIGELEADESDADAIEANGRDADGGASGPEGTKAARDASRGADGSAAEAAAGRVTIADGAATGEAASGATRAVSGATAGAEASASASKAVSPDPGSEPRATEAVAGQGAATGDWADVGGDFQDAMREMGQELGSIGREIGSVMRDVLRGVGREVKQASREAAAQVREASREVRREVSDATREAGRAVSEAGRAVREAGRAVAENGTAVGEPRESVGEAGKATSAAGKPNTYRGTGGFSQFTKELDSLFSAIGNAFRTGNWGFNWGDLGGQKFEFSETREGKFSSSEPTLEFRCHNGKVEIQTWDKDTYRMEIRKSCRAENEEQARARVEQMITVWDLPDGLGARFNNGNASGLDIQARVYLPSGLKYSVKANFHNGSAVLAKMAMAECALRMHNGSAELRPPGESSM